MRLVWTLSGGVIAPGEGEPCEHDGLLPACGYFPDPFLPAWTTHSYNSCFNTSEFRLVLCVKTKTGGLPIQVGWLSVGPVVMLDHVKKRNDHT